MTREQFEHAICAAGAVLGVSAWCLELHDLWISKAVAGRDKDREFCRALLARGVVATDVLRSRLETVPALDARVRSAVAGMTPS